MVLVCAYVFKPPAIGFANINEVRPNDAPGKGSLDVGDRDLIRILERRVSSLETVDRSQQ
jgi:hypothetical protein